MIYMGISAQGVVSSAKTPFLKINKCGWRDAKQRICKNNSNANNENPQIEQFSFENDKELYDFYENFFNTIGGDNNGGEAKTAN